METTVNIKLTTITTCVIKINKVIKVMTTMFIETQLLINNFYNQDTREIIPTELSRYIKDYVFYDIIVGRQRSALNKCKNIIDNAWSRNNVRYNKNYQLDEHWVFTPSIPSSFIREGSSSGNRGLQAVSCIECGNYHPLYHLGVVNMNARKYVICHCHDVDLEQAMFEELVDDIATNGW